MKKLLLTACGFILIGFQSKAQLDTIPNAGFENWNYTPFWTIEATGWQTNNSSIAAWNVIPDSNSHSGVLALKLEKISYRGTIWSGFPIAQHPLTLEGFVKNGLNMGDTALVTVQVYSSNTVVDSAYAEIYGGIGSGYLPFLVNITQSTSTADSCVIMIAGGNIFNSTISFDDLSFTFPTSVNEEFSGDGLMVFPNPCSEQLFIVSCNEIKENSFVTLRDMSGRIIWEEKIHRQVGRFTIHTEIFPSGMYLLTLRNGKNNLHTLIVKD